MTDPVLVNLIMSVVWRGHCPARIRLWLDDGDALRTRAFSPRGDYESRSNSDMVCDSLSSMKKIYRECPSLYHQDR